MKSPHLMIIFLRNEYENKKIAEWTKNWKLHMYVEILRGHMRRSRFIFMIKNNMIKLKKGPSVSRFIDTPTGLDDLRFQIRTSGWLTYPKYNFSLEVRANYDWSVPFIFIFWKAAIQLFGLNYLALISKMNYLGGLGLNYDWPTSIKLCWTSWPTTTKKTGVKIVPI